MAANVYTADEIITAARDISRVTDSTADGTTDRDILRHLNRFLQTTLAPAIKNVSEDYFTRSVRTQLVASTSRYRMHSRAMLQVERDISYINTSGYRTPPLERISRGDADQVIATSSNTKPTGFYIEGNYIVLVPTLGSGAEGYLEETFYMRPGELVLAEDARVVSSVSGTTITLTESVPTDWSAGDSFDIHSAYSGAELKCWDKAAGTVSGTSIVTSTAIDGSISGEVAVTAGDYVCLAGQAAVPGVPYEFHQVLAQAAAVYLMEADGDVESMQIHKAILDEMLRVLLDAMKPRIEGKKERHKKAPFISLQGRGRALNA